MKITKEQMDHIAVLLDNDGIYHHECETEIDEFVWSDYFESIYIDGNISFDRIIDIADYLRTIKELSNK